MGLNGITKEHLVYAFQSVYDRIAELFNSMLQHAIVPDSFHRGDIVPIPKSTRGDKTDVRNFRGICLNSTMLKLFEKILVDVCGVFHHMEIVNFLNVLAHHTIGLYVGGIGVESSS